MGDWLRYGWLRRPLLRLALLLPDGRVSRWLLGFLYPSDMIVRFGGAE